MVERADRCIFLYLSPRHRLCERVDGEQDGVPVPVAQAEPDYIKNAKRLLQPVLDYLAQDARIDAAQPDPLASIIPALDQWPDDAVAWCVDRDGRIEYVVYNGSFWQMWPGKYVLLPDSVEPANTLRPRPAEEAAS